MLKADSGADLRELMGICVTEGQRLGLVFSNNESAVTIVNNEKEKLKIQECVVRRVDKYV